MFELLQKEQEARQALFQYFGYVEDWCVLPFDDATQYFWFVNENEVRYAKTEVMLHDEENGDYYSNEIYTQRHLPKWTYRGKDYTLIVVDTHCDGNKFLQIFSNEKERFL